MAPTPWLSVPRPRPQASCRLFCFPYAGGAARIYQSWATALPSTVELCAVELPGHGKRLAEIPTANLNRLLPALEAALRPLLDKPCIFFGHSLGGLIAFELTRSLQRQPQSSPQALWIAAARAPHLPLNEPLMHTLPNADFITELRRYSGTPNEVLNNAELMALLLPMLRADFALLETYHYQAQTPLTCPIVAFWGEQDAIVSLEEIKPWQLHTDRSFALEKVAGDHFFINRPQILAPIIQKLTQFSASLTDVTQGS
ncbi:MAG: thioesterase II family protein [Leptolyngbyaceae cyanobacterium]